MPAMTCFPKRSECQCGRPWRPAAGKISRGAPLKIAGEWLTSRAGVFCDIATCPGEAISSPGTGSKLGRPDISFPAAKNRRSKRKELPPCPGRFHLAAADSDCWTSSDPARAKARGKPRTPGICCWNPWRPGACSACCRRSSTAWWTTAAWSSPPPARAGPTAPTIRVFQGQPHAPGWTGAKCRHLEYTQSPVGGSLRGLRHLGGRRGPGHQRPLHHPRVPFHPAGHRPGRPAPRPGG
jgi:hypothetical protein